MGNSRTFDWAKASVATLNYRRVLIWVSLDFLIGYNIGSFCLVDFFNWVKYNNLSTTSPMTVSKVNYIYGYMIWVNLITTSLFSRTLESFCLL